MFSFMLCGEIMRQRGDISDNEWNFFLRGSGSLDKVRILRTRGAIHYSFYIMTIYLNSSSLLFMSRVDFLHPKTSLYFTTQLSFMTLTFSLSLQERPARPDIPWLTEHMWNTCCDLEVRLVCDLSTPTYSQRQNSIVLPNLVCKILNGKCNFFTG